MADHDLLAQANAALRLGDLVAPPRGSVVELPDRQRYRVVSELEEGTTPFSRHKRAIIWLREILGATTPEKTYLGGRLPIHLDGIVAVLDLPADCPRFEHWQRPSHG